MDCKDLMIGDWVNYKSPSSGKLRPIKIENIYGAEFNCEVEVWNIISGMSISDTEPIPITEDILVKNGFEKSTRVGTYELNTDYYEIEVWDYSDGLWVVKVQYIEFSSLPYSQATITHVHALQHLLRLFGIEKELTI